MKNNLPVTHHNPDYLGSDVIAYRTDINGIITYANDAFVEISNFSREELVEKNHDLVRHPDMPPWVFADLWQTVQRSQPWHGTVKNRTKNGGHYWVRTTVSPILKDGKIIGYLSLMKKPTSAEVVYAEALYKSGKTPSEKFSVRIWLRNLSLHLPVFQPDASRKKLVC